MATVRSPRTQSFWLLSLCYATVCVCAKFLFQLDAFCVRLDSHAYALQPAPECPLPFASLAALHSGRPAVWSAAEAAASGYTSDRDVAPDWLLGLHKTLPAHALFLYVLSDLLVLLAVVFHRSVLLRKGVWFADEETLGDNVLQQQQRYRLAPMAAVEDTSLGALVATRASGPVAGVGSSGGGGGGGRAAEGERKESEEEPERQPQEEEEEEEEVEEQNEEDNDEEEAPADDDDAAAPRRRRRVKRRPAAEPAAATAAAAAAPAPAGGRSKAAQTVSHRQSEVGQAVVEQYDKASKVSALPVSHFLFLGVRAHGCAASHLFLRDRNRAWRRGSSASGPRCLRVCATTTSPLSHGTSASRLRLPLRPFLSRRYRTCWRPRATYARVCVSAGRTSIS